MSIAIANGAGETRKGSQIIFHGVLTGCGNVWAGSLSQRKGLSHWFNGIGRFGMHAEE